MTFRWLALAYLGVTTLVAQAQETAAVMPPRIVRVRAIAISGQTIYDRTNASGERIPLLEPLNRSVSTATMAQSDAELKQLYTKLNEFQAGLGDSLMQADLKTTSSIDFKRTIYALEYGITRKISFGFMAPILEMRMKSTFNAQLQEQVAKVKAATNGVADELTAGLDKLAANLPNTATFENAVFTSKGYQIPGDYKVQGLGDAEAGLKYQLVNNDWTLFSAQVQFRAPTTSHTEDYTRLLDKGLGDKQWDVGLYLNWDLMPNPNLVFGTMVKLTSQRPDNIRRPVLRTWESDLPDMTDANAWANVHRNLGDMIETELSTTYYFDDRAWNIYGAYQFAHKGQDQYSGSRTDLNYAWLSAGTSTTAHNYETGIGYSTIQHYFKKRFPVPFELKYGFNSTFAAKNTVHPSYHRFNLLMYF